MGDKSQFFKPSSGKVKPEDLHALWLSWSDTALWQENLVATVGGKVNNTLLTLLKEVREIAI